MKIVAMKNLFNESHLETSLAEQAFKQDKNYEEYELWRLNLYKRIKNTIRAIKFPLGISPAQLRDALLKQQEDLELNVVSPVNYYFYVQRIKKLLLSRYKLLKGYRYAFEEAQARLRATLQENPTLALNYFYQDVFNHIVRASAYHSAPKQFFKALSFYQSLIPQSYYQAVFKNLEQFCSMDKTLSNHDYREQLRKLDNIFNPLSNDNDNDKNLLFYLEQGIHYLRSHPMSLLVPMAMGLFYTQYQQTTIFSTIHFLTTATTCYALRYTSLSTSSNIGLMVGFANVLPIISAQNATTYYSEILTRNPGSRWREAHISTGFRFDAGDFLWMGVYTPNEYTYSSFSLDLANNGSLLNVTILAGNLSSAVYDIVQTSDQGIAAVGYVNPQYNKKNVLIIKYSANGNYQWSRLIDNVETKGLSIMPTPDNGVVLLIADDNYAAMLKLASNGDVLWWADEMPPFSAETGVPAVTVTSDSNPVVISSSLQDEGQTILSLAKVNNTDGVLLWSADIPSFLTISAYNTITALKNNGIAVAVKDSNNAIVIMKFSEDGDFIWGQRLEQNQENYGVQDIVSASNGNVVVMMSAYGTDENNHNVLLFELQSSDGQLQWYNLLSNIADQLIGAGSISIDTDGGLIIALPIDYSESDSNSIYSGFYIAKLLSNGSLPNCNSNPEFLVSFIDISILPIPGVTTRVSPYPIVNITFYSYYNDNTKNWTTIPFCPETPPNDNPWPISMGESIAAVVTTAFICVGVVVGGGVVLYRRCTKKSNSVLPINLVNSNRKNKDAQEEEKKGLIPQNNIVSDIKIPKTISLRFSKVREKCDILKEELIYDKADKKTFLGKGAYGTVYKGFWTKINAEVAIKELEKLEQKFIRDLKKEAIILAEVEHRNIVGFYGVVVEENFQALVIEYIPNGSLFDLLHKKKLSLNPQERKSLALGIGDGLLHLHGQEILHRDLKSLNVLVHIEQVGNEARYVPKLCDFGLAKVTNDFISSSSNSDTVGTARWAAPEILRGKEYTDKADAYSYAMVLWELSTSKIPLEECNQNEAVSAELTLRFHQNETPEKISPELSECEPEMDEAIRGGWRVNVKARSSVKEIVGILAKRRDTSSKETRNNNNNNNNNNNSNNNNNAPETTSLGKAVQKPRLSSMGL